VQTKYLMIAGTASHVGKSVIVTGLCRIFSDMGYSVAPFKSQNMSLNSWVTKDGDEIGIAQAVQAWGARCEPSADMNPVLLKPKGDMVSQVIVRGKPIGDRNVREYYDSVNDILAVIEGSLKRLSQTNDIIIMEGAGSPAEINLYHKDVANIRVAKLVNAPVILVGDIERGGVFASLYGTVQLLPAEDRNLIKGFIINKFRGDIALLEPGFSMLEERTGTPVLGVLPYVFVGLPSEDSVSLAGKSPDEKKSVEIAVIKLPRISNFTDFEPLETDANVRYVNLTDDLGQPDAIILPGTKNTIDDLKELKGSGMAEQIIQRAGKIPILGICGGFQMLGKLIRDDCIEGSENNFALVEGLGLLNVSTSFSNYEKETKQVEKVVIGRGPLLNPIRGQTIRGYEIHMGKTPSYSHVFSEDGAQDEAGLTLGTYLHGLFGNVNFKETFLEYIRTKKRDSINRHPQKTERKSNANRNRHHSVKDPFDNVADVIRQNININILLAIMGL
jgi:adenosylcobyric acid synthase